MISSLRRVGYASSSFGKTLLWSALDLFLLYYLIEIAGFSPAVASTLVLVSVVWDALFSPLLSYLIERLRSRVMTFGVYVLVGAPVAGLALAILFSPPVAGGAWAIAQSSAALIFFKSAYAVIDIPNNAMLASLTQSSSERLALSNLRFVFGAVASLLISLGFYYALLPDVQEAESANLLLVGVGIAIVSTATLWLSVYSVKKYDFVKRGAKASISLGTLLRLLGRNRQLLLLVVSSFVGYLFISIFAKSVPFYAKHIIGEDSAAGVAFAAMTIAQILFLPVLSSLAQRFERRRMLQVTLLSLAAVLLGLFLFRTQEALLFAGIAGLAAVFIHGANMMLWASVTDTVEYGEWRFGERAEAATMGFFTLMNKVGKGFSTSLLGFIFALSDYDAGQSASEPDPDIVALAMTFVPAVGAIVIVLLLQGFRLTEPIHERIRRFLSSRSSVKA